MLLVDDEELMRFLVERRLKGSGLSLKTCSSAQEAHEFLLINRARLLLLDFRLPLITGDELLEKLIAEDCLGETRVYVCSSARPQESICRKLERLGVTILEKEVILSKRGIESLLT